MGLSRLKAQAKINAVRLFANRESALDAFHGAIAEYKQRNILRVISFCGVGGVGKTHLLKKLVADLKDSKDFAVATIDVESPHYSSLIDMLRSIMSLKNSIPQADRVLQVC